MDLKTRIESDLRDAMRNSDELRKRTLRMVIANIKLTEIDRGAKLDDNGVIAILQKEVKSRREAIADAEKANRNDLIQASHAEMEVLASYLPKAMSDLELKAAAQETIQELGTSSPADMGRVMKALMAKLQGRAAGDQISRIVRELLQK